MEGAAGTLPARPKRALASVSWKWGLGAAKASDFDVPGGAWVAVSRGTERR
jgi:hypothetical protein